MAVTGTTLKNALAPAGLRLVTRAEWGARARRYVNYIQLPSPYFFVHHAAVESSDDAREVRAHQNYHMDVKGWSDIAYSLLVPDPNPNFLVFEGRGIGVQGGHTAGYNRSSHAVCVLGNFQVDSPSANTLETVARLVKVGRNKRWWGTHVGGHRDVSTSSCPGNNLYAKLPWIRTRASNYQVGALPAPAPAPTSTRPAYRPYPSGMPVSLGDRGTAVKIVQQVLRERRYSLIADGVFGPITRHAVVHWQTKHGLVPDGVVGPKTWHSLLYA